MTIADLLEQLGEAMDDGTVNESSSVVALMRNTGVALSSEDAWRELGVVSAELDGHDCDLLTGPLENVSPLTVSGLRTALDSLGPGTADCDVYVRGDQADLGGGWSARTDVPVIATVCNSERSMFGVLPSYDGYEEDLG